MEHRNTTLDDVASVIGFTLTLRLAAWFGDGNNLYVPPVPKEDHMLVKLLGKRPAELLAEAFPGEWLAIPRLTAYEEEERRRRVALFLTRGCSTREVARLERMSERRIQQICRELEVAGVIPPIGRDKTQDEAAAVVRKRPGKSGRAKFGENW